MDAAMLTHLLALRYRLIWAQARTGSGKLLLLLVGWLFGMLFMAFATLGGFGAAQTAIEMGQADRVAPIVLGGVFLVAILSSAVMGIHVEPAFADASLRRYPLSPSERFVARQATAALGPLWLFVLALYLGVGAGLSLYSVGRAWLALPAAFLLMISNYLLARLLLEWLSRVLQTRIGSLALLVLGVLIGLLVPALISPSTPGRDAVLVWLTRALPYTPPGAAAAAMAGHQVTTSLTGFAGLLAWAAGLAVALVASERLPPVSRAVAGAPIRWDDPYDRISRLFGPQLGPLVGKTMRYYVRSPHLRFNYPIFIPMLMLLVWHGTRNVADNPTAVFVVILGVFSCLGFVTTGMSLNVFGFDGPGFRRYFLLPVAPSKVLLAASLVAILPGLSLTPIALLLWLLYGPGQTDLPMVAMLVSSAVGGTLLYQALGLWSSLLGPRSSPLKVTFGKTLSLAGNAVMMVSIFWMVFWMTIGPRVAARFGSTLMRHWWIVPLFAAVAAAFFVATVAAGSVVLVRRRERMLSQIDRQPRVTGV